MSDYKKVIDDLAKTVADLKVQIEKNKQSGTPMDEDRVAAIVNKKLEAAAPVQNRKGAYLEDEADGSATMSKHSTLVQKSNDQKVVEFQKWNDNCVLLSQLLDKPVRSLKYFQKSKDNKGLTELAKAMDSATSNEGAEWIPTEFSQELYYLVHLATKVAAAVRQFNMPSNPYKLPLQKTEASTYLTSENTADSGNKFTASTPQTNNVTFTAVKLATRVLFSEELSEDAIVPVLDFVKNTIATAVAFGLEDALINGDNSTTHMDSDVTSSTDPRKAWKGLRKMGLNASLNKDINTLSTANIRDIRAKMGKYGVDPSKLMYIVSAKGLIKMLSLAEVMTMEKYGANATILSGELGRLDNIPIIVSEKMRDDLNASGYNDSTTNAFGAIICAYVPAFMLGVKRQLTTRARFDEETDQTILVNSWRGDFESWLPYTTEPVSNLGVHMTV
jgi:HK97 family phage major capsid protein